MRAIRVKYELDVETGVGASERPAAGQIGGLHFSGKRWFFQRSVRLQRLPGTGIEKPPVRLVVSERARESGRAAGGQLEDCKAWAN
jgi:hypothetical protein